MLAVQSDHFPQQVEGQHDLHVKTGRDGTINTSQGNNDTFQQVHL